MTSKTEGSEAVASKSDQSEMRESDTSTSSNDNDEAQEEEEKPELAPGVNERILAALAGEEVNLQAQDSDMSGYHDYAADGPETVPLSRSTREATQTFPMKLYAILSNPEFQTIIAWLPHGRAWRILQHKAFEEHVIPLYFRHGRYSSFARQVNGWGFRRITAGTDYNSYYHEMFLRGLPHLCEKMKRLTPKDAKQLTHKDAPDFYRMSRDHPLPTENFATAIMAGQAPGAVAFVPPIAGVPGLVGFPPQMVMAAPNGIGFPAGVPVLPQLQMFGAAQPGMIVPVPGAPVASVAAPATQSTTSSSDAAAQAPVAVAAPVPGLPFNFLAPPQVLVSLGQLAVPPTGSGSSDGEELIRSLQNAGVAPGTVETVRQQMLQQEQQSAPGGPTPAPTEASAPVNEEQPSEAKQPPVAAVPGNDILAALQQHMLAAQQQADAAAAAEAQAETSSPPPAVVPTGPTQADTNAFLAALQQQLQAAQAAQAQPAPEVDAEAPSAPKAAAPTTTASDETDENASSSDPAAGMTSTGSSNLYSNLTSFLVNNSAGLSSLAGLSGGQAPQPPPPS